MAQRGKIIRLWRGARQHPEWSLGDPVKPRARLGRRGSAGRRRASWRTRVGLVGAAVTLGAVFLPTLIDALNGVVKPADGCRVYGVVDGDTVRLHCPATGFENGRVLGLDTPEYDARCLSEFGRAILATQALRWQLWTASQISVQPRDLDRYGRRLVRLRVDGHDIAGVLIGQGLARPYDGGPRQGWCTTAPGLPRGDRLPQIR